MSVLSVVRGEQGEQGREDKGDKGDKGREGKGKGVEEPVRLFSGVPEPPKDAFHWFLKLKKN